MHFTSLRSHRPVDDLIQKTLCINHDLEAILRLLSVLPRDTSLSRTPLIILLENQLHSTYPLDPATTKFDSKNTFPHKCSLSSSVRVGIDFTWTDRILCSRYLCRARSRRVSRSMSRSGAWQVSAETHSRLLVRTVGGAPRRASGTNGARFGAVDRMNERFLAVDAENNSLRHTRVVPRESQHRFSPLFYHPRTHHFLAPSLGASLYPTHSPPCLSHPRARQSERDVDRLRRLAAVQRRASTPVSRITLSKQSAWRAVNPVRGTSRRIDDDNVACGIVTWIAR